MAIHNTPIQQSINSSTVVDLLERILDRGIVIVGDIKVKLVEVELLTIQIQLVVCSVDKAKEIGINWWDKERQLLHHQEATTRDDALLESVKQLNHRIESLEKKLEDSQRKGTNDQSP